MKLNKYLSEFRVSNTEYSNNSLIIKYVFNKNTDLCE